MKKSSAPIGTIMILITFRMAFREFLSSELWRLNFLASLVILDA